MVDDVWALLEMTPYRYKTSQAGLDRVRELERLEVTFEFVVTVYKKYENNNKKWGINGEGIAFHEGKPVFIENAIPEEVIEFDIKRDEDTYLIGEMTRLVEQSSKRRYPLCPIWKECGGCALMHVKYPAQCKMKEGNLKETLIKYADYNGRILPILKIQNHCHIVIVVNFLLVKNMVNYIQECMSVTQIIFKDGKMLCTLKTFRTDASGRFKNHE